MSDVLTVDTIRAAVALVERVAPPAPVVLGIPRRMIPQLTIPTDQLVYALDDYKVQVRFPRSKKKRIRKKWRKDSSNFEWRTPQPMAIDMSAVMRPFSIGRVDQ